MIVKLPFGIDRMNVDLRGLRVRALAPTAPREPDDVSGLIGEALNAPLEGPSLEDLARGRSSATVVVPDATRKACLPDVLPVVLEHLNRGGVADDSITVLVANGTHPAVGCDGVAELVGAVSGRVRIIEHDSRTGAGLVAVGELRPGVPLRLNRDAVASDFLLTIATVRHHYFAGFGGGPKMVFPGVAGYEEIQANHSMVLRPSGGSWDRHPNCEPGVLSGNPVAEEIMRAADLRPPDCSLCMVEGRGGGIAWAGAGPWRVAFDAAVKKVRSWFCVEPKASFDLMVGCGGGAPSDRTLIQGHKSLDAACRFLAPGGEILYIAALDRGLGSDDMAPFVDDPRPEAILDRLALGWVQYGHTTLRLMEKTSRYRVRLHSHLDHDLARKLGFEPVSDPETVIEEWRQDHPGKNVGVMAGAAVYPSSPDRST
jgi:nickel-dependent lactate racemase